jgi:hypothetical protein
MPNAKPLSVAELNAIIPRLHATLALLAGAGTVRAAAPARAAASPARGRGRRGRRGSSAGAAIQGKLLAALGHKKGLSMSEVVKRASLPRGAAAYHLRVLRGKKKVRVVGTRGQARWFAA